MSEHPTTIRTRRWRALNREKNRLASKVYHQRQYAKGDQRNSYRPWKADEDRMLLARELSIVEISKRLGRSINSLNTRRRQLESGCVIPKRRSTCRWSDVEGETLRTLIEGEPVLGWAAWSRISDAMRAAGFDRSALACSTRHQILKGKVYKRKARVDPTV